MIEEKTTGIRTEVIKEIIDLAKQYNINKVFLFGSRARGDYKDRSDVDLAITGGDTTKFTLNIDEKTSTLLMFDVVDLDKNVQEDLMNSIMKEGIIIYEKI